MENRFRVVLYCSKSNERLIEHVKNGLLQRLSLSDSVLEKLFSGQPIVVQHAVSEEKALQYRDAIEAAGGVCEVEPLSLNRSVDEVGFIERRESERRSDARRSEHGVIPDRRRGDRRKRH
jgi:hypothetical protein